MRTGTASMDPEPAFNFSDYFRHIIATWPIIWLQFVFLLMASCLPLDFFFSPDKLVLVSVFQEMLALLILFPILPTWISLAIFGNLHLFTRIDTHISIIIMILVIIMCNAFDHSSPSFAAISVTKPCITGVCLEVHRVQKCRLFIGQE